MNVDRRRDGLERGVLVADGHELDELHAVGVALGGAARELDTDRRLADAAGADERDETVLVEGGSEALEERLPADERLQRGGERRLLRQLHLPTVFGSGRLERLHRREELVTL